MNIGFRNVLERYGLEFQIKIHGFDEGVKTYEKVSPRAVVLKLFLIVYHLCVPYCYHVPPCSRKSQCAKYHSIKSLENQN